MAIEAKMLLAELLHAKQCFFRIASTFTNSSKRNVRLFYTLFVLSILFNEDSLTNPFDNGSTRHRKVLWLLQSLEQTATENVREKWLGVIQR